MKIVVCVRIGLDGEINPFDAASYEAALLLGGEVTLLSMGAPKIKDALMSLTRLGASRAILLTDPAFAGADTLATAYTLSVALKKLSYDLVFFGKKTLVGDTAQTGPMTAALLSLPLISGAMSIKKGNEKITVATRDSGAADVQAPALITFERCYSLRFPRLGSRMQNAELWSLSDIGASAERCGIKGSPTRVIRTFENSFGRRKCKLIGIDELKKVISEGLEKGKQRFLSAEGAESEKLGLVCIVGEKPREYAESISESIYTISDISPRAVEDKIRELSPDAVLFSTDPRSKETAAQVAAHLSLGLCADCTRLECNGGKMIMYRPALSGSIIAKIESLTRPTLATVRTAQDDGKSIVVSVGLGAKDQLDKAKHFAERLGAELCSSRRMVDNGYMPYSSQVGLTGKTVSPSVFIALGISGAVHHVTGFDRSDTVIAINSDKNAPIFDYADYGIVCDLNETDLDFI